MLKIIEVYICWPTLWYDFFPNQTYLHVGLFSSIKKFQAEEEKKEGYDEKANVDASREVLAMNIDELVEGLEEE